VTDGVYGIDVGLFDAGFVSGYLFDGESPTLVDPGPPAGVETVLAACREADVPPADLENVVLSHIHLDHAGAAGALVEAVPGLDVYVHEATAHHLIEPETLVERTRSAMGEYFEAMGEPLPVPAANVVEVPEGGATLDVGANTLEMVYAPGHSPDHFAVWNPERELLYGAESVVNYFERADRWGPPSTLPNFDPETLNSTIERLRKLEPAHLVIPHFGVYPDDPAEAFDRGLAELGRYDERIRKVYAATESVEATREAVAVELLDLSPPYDPCVEAFYARLVTDGYLNYHGLL
jgi:glyoxylase-like metal-dependent hydrolase (beta-lactamase superfamily II)